MDQRKPQELAAALRKIADALGVPVEGFYAGEPSTGSAASEDEWLRLWSEIRTDEGRRQALVALRLIAKLERR